jgi:hypothetical protein
MFCARCDKPIKDGGAQAVDVDRPTGAGQTVYVHPYLCRKPKSQTSPASRPKPVREG